MTVRSHEDYSEKYLADYGFEVHQVHYRRQTALERLAAHSAAARLLEVGCGVEPILPFVRGCESYTVVEPAAAFLEAAKEKTGSDPRARFIKGTLEEAAPELAGTEFTAILAMGLLQEVPDQMEFLRSVRKACSPRTLVHVSVTNGRSFHRELAWAMGLMGDPLELSPRAHELQQQRVYTLESLRLDVEASGFQVINEGGILMKPFTHRQMEQLQKCGLLTPQMLDGLQRLGGRHPALASEIYMDLRMA